MATSARFIVIVAISAEAVGGEVVESLVGGFAGADGDGGCGYAHRNLCLSVKATFAGSVKFPANKAFAARAAILAVVVWLWGQWWE